jgi:endonuclease-8
VPEGDTLFRAAAWLHAELADRPIDKLWLRAWGEVKALAGARVTEVRARGKHVLAGLATNGADRAEAVLHFHLGMYGKVRRYEQFLEVPSATTALYLERGGARWVVLRAMIAELVHRGALADHPQLSRLGPDILAPRIDLAEIVRRARRVHHPTIADLLVDQTVAAGIGNAWKCEALFAEGIHPLRPPEQIGDDALLALLRRARELMAESVASGARDPHFPVPRSAPAARRWVYGREGRPCPECGAPIRVRRMGDGSRGVWYCPRCQPR